MSKFFGVHILPVPSGAGEVDRYVLKDGTIGTQTTENPLQAMTQEKAWEERDRFNAIFKELDTRFYASVCLL